MRVSRIRSRGVVTNISAARGLLSQPGDICLVERQSLRAAALKCPCGCGDDLIINLDKRAGPAWHLYQNRYGITIYPSYWRSDGCKSHFIIWNDDVCWCGVGDYFGTSEATLTSLDELVLRSLNSVAEKHYYDISVEAKQNPWDVLDSCRRLARNGVAEGTESGYFKIKTGYRMSW